MGYIADTAWCAEAATPGLQESLHARGKRYRSEWIEVVMYTATKELGKHITATLARVRIAREAGDPGELSLYEHRLDVLLSRVPRRHPVID